MDAQFVRFGFPGMLRQFKDGRLLGVEVKGPPGKLRPEQAAFLERVPSAGGVVPMACICSDVLRELN